MYTKHSTPTVHALARLRQRVIANQCTCGAPGAVYADDGVTPLCGRCWWAIYGKDAGQ